MAASFICYNDDCDTYYELKRPVSEWPEFLRVYLDKVNDTIIQVSYSKDICLDLSYSSDEILYDEFKYLIPKFNELIADRVGKYTSLQETFIRFYNDLSKAIEKELGSERKPPKTRTIEATLKVKECDDDEPIEHLFLDALVEDATNGKVEAFWEAYLVWWHAKGKHFKGFARFSQNPNVLYDDMTECTECYIEDGSDSDSDDSECDIEDRSDSDSECDSDDESDSE